MDAREADSESDSDGPDLVYVDKDKERTKVDNFTAKTCSCHFGPDSTPCSTFLIAK